MTNRQKYYVQQWKLIDESRCQSIIREKEVFIFVDCEWKKTKDTCLQFWQLKTEAQIHL